jgi:hypothetical protein
LNEPIRTYRVHLPRLLRTHSITTNVVVAARESAYLIVVRARAGCLSGTRNVRGDSFKPLTTGVGEVVNVSSAPIALPSGVTATTR